MSHDAGQGPPVLDIGGEIGALVLLTDEAYVGREIDISPLADPGVRTHTAVHRRTVGGRTCGAGVYPALTEGHYRVHGDRPDLPTEVEIRGGEVTQLDWR